MPSISEKYSTGWILKINGEKIDSKHYLSNQFFNSWYIDIDKVCSRVECKKNELEIELIYSPNPPFVWAFIFSIITLFSSIGWIVYRKYFYKR